MADEVFRPTRKRVTQADLGEPTNPTPAPVPSENPLDAIRQVQHAMHVATDTDKNVVAPRPLEQAPFQISGSMPKEFQEVLARRAQQVQGSTVEAQDAFDAFEAPPERPRSQPKAAPRATPDKHVPTMDSSDTLKTLLEKLSNHHTWETFSFPSKGKFYREIPPQIHIRAMTGEEEQILATPRWVKKGKAIDMIFRRCVREPINTEELLSADRTNLLIYLRGISYTPEYDVEIKCPACSMKFAHVINLDLNVESCPDDFGPDSLQGALPISGFHYSYRLPTGADEQEISMYREKRVQQWGENTEDDTLLYRTALLLEEIEGVTMKRELAMLLKKLPIQDVAHLRNEINMPPFGVDTEIPLLCPVCSEEFKIDLPLETNFFFPRKRMEKSPV